MWWAACHSDDCEGVGACGRRSHCGCGSQGQGCGIKIERLHCFHWQTKRVCLRISKVLVVSWDGWNLGCCDMGLHVLRPWPLPRDATGCRGRLFGRSCIAPR